MKRFKDRRLHLASWERETISEMCKNNPHLYGEVKSSTSKSVEIRGHVPASEPVSNSNVYTIEKVEDPMGVGHRYKMESALHGRDVIDVTYSDPIRVHKMTPHAKAELDTLLDQITRRESAVAAASRLGPSPKADAKPNKNGDVFTGPKFMDSGIIYAPYIPLTKITLIGPDMPEYHHGIEIP